MRVIAFNSVYYFSKVLLGSPSRAQECKEVDEIDEMPGRSLTDSVIVSHTTLRHRNLAVLQDHLIITSTLENSINMFAQ